MKNKSLYISLLLILINIVFFFRNTLISLLPEILAFFIKIVILFYPFLIAALMSYFVYSIRSLNIPWIEKHDKGQIGLEDAEIIRIYGMRWGKI